jgi:hypothetical protein
VTHLTAQAVRPLSGPLSVYARYEFLDNFSNISFYSFQSNTFSLGLTASF